MPPEVSTFRSAGAYSEVSIPTRITVDSRNCIVATITYDGTQFVLPALFEEGSTATATSITIPGRPALRFGTQTASAGAKYSLADAKSQRGALVGGACEIDGYYWLVAEITVPVASLLNTTQSARPSEQARWRSPQSGVPAETPG